MYNWLPNTAEETSNPLPTLPCAKQCTNCAVLCASLRASLSGWVNASRVITPSRSRRAETMDVMSAAEDPIPVLLTLSSWTSCGQKGAILAKDATVLGRFSSWS